MYIYRDNLTESEINCFALPAGEWTYTEVDNITGRPIYRKEGEDYEMSYSTRTPVREQIPTTSILCIARAPNQGGR